MSWKMPIPTDLDNVFVNDPDAKWIYIDLLLRSRVTSGVVKRAGRVYDLNRGQCVCGEQELANGHQIGRKKARILLETLEKRYNRIHNRRTTKGTVVTILNFDEVTKMDNRTDNRGTTEGQQRDNRPHTNKSVLECKNERVGEYTHSKFSNKKEKGEKPNIVEISKDLSVSQKTVERYHQKIVDYQKSTGRTYKDIGSTIRLWIREDISAGKLKLEEEDTHIPTDVEREWNKIYGKED